VLAQGRQQDAAKWLSNYDRQTIKLPIAEASIEFLRDLPRKSLCLEPAWGTLAAGCVTRDCAAAASYRRCTIKDATRPIGLEIPVMQPRSRVVQPQDKQHRPIASL